MCKLKQGEIPLLEPQCQLCSGPGGQNLQVANGAGGDDTWGPVVPLAGQGEPQVRESSVFTWLGSLRPRAGTAGKRGI